MKKEPNADEIRQRRAERILRIKTLHPVYEQFDFEAYSNEKIAEMYQILVPEDEADDKGGSAQ
jgi:hypothetical protein